MEETDYNTTGHRKQRKGKNITSSSISQNSKIIVEMNHSKTTLCIIILTIIAMFLPTIYSDTGTDFEVCDAEICRKSTAILTSSMNESVDPCEDFYQFACGTFESNYSSNNSTEYYNNWFEIIKKKVNEMIKKFLTQNDEKHEPAAIHKTRLFYKSCLNDKKDDKDYFTEDLLNLLQNVGLSMDYLNDSAPLDLEKIIAKISVSLFKETFISISTVNQKSHVKLAIKSVGSLKSNNYKVRSQGIKTKQNTNEKSISSPEYFNAMIDKLPDNIIIQFKKLFDDDRMKQKLRDFTDKFEKMSQNRDHNDNNIDEDFTLGKLQNLTDTAASALKFNWKLCMKEILRDTNPNLYEQLASEFSDQYQIKITNRQYLRDLFTLLAETPKIILKMTILNNVISDWENKFKSSDDKNVDYCTKLTTELFGLVTGYSLIDTLNTSSKTKLNEMVDNIKWASREIINELAWMDDETKKATFRKLDRMKIHLGYPDNYTDILNNLYQELYLTENHEENIKSASTYLKRMYMKLKEEGETDTILWLSGLNIINAYAVPSKNAFFMPVPILQFPFYHNGLQVLDYAAAGSIIGHELTHNFDSNGRNYNEFGDNVQWWSKKSIEEYTKRADCLVDYYNNITIIGHNKTLKINGTQTLGENISDIIGLKETYYAYKRYVDIHGIEPRLPGFERFSQEQLFFLGYANHYCFSDKSDIQLTSDDVHSPFFVRVQKVLSMLPEFTKAWSCPLGSGMNPNITKCSIY